MTQISDADSIRSALENLLRQLDALATLHYGSDQHREHLAHVQAIKRDFETREKHWDRQHCYHWGEAL